MKEGYENLLTTATQGRTMSYQEMLDTLSYYLGDDLLELKQKLYAKIARDSHGTWE
jgi:hypothetical protein